MINSVFLRTWHRRVSMFFLIPFILVSITGFLLTIRTITPWIQPPQMKAAPGFPQISLEALWSRAQNIPAAELKELSDLKSIEVKIQSGTVNFRAKNGFEIQFDAKTGQILSSKQRWTPFLVELHEGTFLPNWLQRIVYIPLGIVLIFLSLSGTYLFLIRLKNKKK